MRTLVISDLHLGAHRERDLLRRPWVLEALLRELEFTDRLVLLGDIIELRHGPAAAALRLAKPVLNALGGAMEQSGEVVLVPGNHDHHLLEPWLERRVGGAQGGGRAALALETAVAPEPGEPLSALIDALSPAQVRVAYPGVWLREDVFATHGHLADRHTTIPMLERVAAGVMALIVSEPLGGPQRIEDYEAALAPVYAWIHAVAQTGASRLGRSSHGGTSSGAWQTLSAEAPKRGSRSSRARRRALQSAFPLLIATLNRAGIGPLRWQLSAEELRRAPIRAMDEVLARLGVQAEHVIFGHTHRAGPLSVPPDPLWRGRAGQRLLNTGCWVHEPSFLGPRPERSPYRAGFAVRIEGQAPPELTNLLDGDPAARAPG